MPLHRSCPLCDGRRARPAWHEDGLRYVRCSNCGVLFSDVDEAAYSVGQHNAWHEDRVDEGAAAFYGTARERVHEQFLAVHTPTGEGRLLDVGCGLGYFVERALHAGWDAYGCDTSGPWTSAARDRVGEDRIHDGLADPTMLGGLRYDLVTAWDVVEHVHDPLPFLRTLRDLLAPNGKLFLRTPNVAWVYPTYWARRRLLNEPVELGPLNHVVYYGAATMSRGLREAGLEPVEWPVLPPPQVGRRNDDPTQAGSQTLTVRVKNAHAAASAGLARWTRGRIVLGSDLDVVARAQPGRSEE